VKTRATGPKSSLAQHPAGRGNPRLRKVQAGVGLWPLQSAQISGHDDPLLLRPPKLEGMTDEQLGELIDLVAEMLSAEPEAKVVPLRRAA
jgi:hypothetical protein